MGTADSTFRSLLARAASAYTAGPALENARSVCVALSQLGIANVVCYWDANSDSPSVVCRTYIRALRMIADVTSDCYLSIKAPALHFDLNLVKEILEEARRLDARVHFDAMAPETVDRTFDLINAAHATYSKLGCTLPARWRRSLTDADHAVDLGLHVRVVKGEWAGINGDETDAREGFLNVIDRLAGRARHVAVATHNLRVARRSLDKLQKTVTPCELELLYGLPRRRLLKIAARMNVRARLYIPYGHAGLPYRLKSAVHHPRVIGWFIRDLVRGNSSCCVT